MSRPALPVTRTVNTRIPEVMVEKIMEHCRQTGRSMGKQIEYDLAERYGLDLAQLRQPLNTAKA